MTALSVAGGGFWSGVAQRVRRALLAPRPPGFFDADWYRVHYHDVAAAGIDPWLHFHFHGRDEGRLANRRHVDLWFSDSTFRQVEQEFHRGRDALAGRDRAYLAWLLARRLAWNGQWDEVIALKPHLGFGRPGRKSGFGHMPAVLYVDALQKTGAAKEALGKLDWLKGQFGELTDIALLEANHIQAFGDTAAWPEDWLRVVNRIFEARGLQPIRFRSGAPPRLDALTSPDAGLQGANDDSRPLVSVLMAAFNAESAVGQAIRSVMAQTWTNLELVVVDDGSTDATAERVAQIARNDERVRLLEAERHGGPYAARNQALAAARGDFMTLHDADDWSHPEKISRQMARLEDDKNLKGCMSCWARATPGLEFGNWDHPSTWSGWVHMNPSSFLCSKEVFDQLGYWDEVKCGADIEFIDRVKAAWGSEAVGRVEAALPLTFGCIAEDSLTASAATHIMTVLKGVRADYQKAYSQWHRQARCPADLYMHRSIEARPFAAPAAIRFDDEC